MSHNSINRFSDRVENYVKYRPHYPKEVIAYLTEQNVLSKSSVIADIGSGTGISTELFLGNGNKVNAVEPNKEMREAAENLLKGNKNFVSVNGTAEDTTLQDNSVDIVLAGQAFHWFDIPKSKAEFKRILKSDGYVVLMWNVKQLDSSPFMKAYEDMLLTFGTDYREVKHENLGEDIFKLFFDKGCGIKTFENVQVFNFEGLKGRLLSSSYAPNVSHPDYEPMLKALKAVFDKFNVKGKVRFEYVTTVYYGRL